MPRLAAGLVALVAWAGLAIQFGATLGQSQSVADALWVVLRYFTIITNLIVALVMSAVALGRSVRPALLAGTVLAILLVGIVYMTLLRGLVELSGGALLADALLHKATPLLVPAWWVAFAPKGLLGWRAPWWWSLFPLSYFLYALVRGEIEGRYAYPFIDVAKLGAPAVALNAVLIAALFVLAGFALVALDRRLGGAPLKG